MYHTPCIFSEASSARFFTRILVLGLGFVLDVVVVVVVLLFYVHGKHLRSCRDGQLT